MLEINSNVVFVRGAKKGAIYDFNSENVYWISEESCDFIEKLYNSCDKSVFTSEEEKYINELVAKGLYSLNYKIKDFSPVALKEEKLDLAWLEITQSCNCRCVHCYQGEVHCSSKNQLTLSDWERVIDELVACEVSRVVVIGGEPCVYKDLIPILKKLIQVRINTTLFTNATCINESLLNLIIENKDLINVKVSVYGKSAAIHDRVTQINGSFDKLVSTIKKLTSKNVRVDIAVVAMRENQDDLDGFKEFAKELGANYSKFDVIRNVFGGGQDQHTPTNQEVIRSAKFCAPCFKASKKRFIDNMVNNSCWYGKLVISENGDVLPCVFERNIILGNVKEQSIEDILHSSSVSSVWHMDFSCIDSCKDCEFRFSCKDCRPLAHSVEGKYTTKNPRCCYNPYEGEWKND